MKLKFHPLSQDIEWTVPAPKPAKNYKPQWLSKMPLVVGKPNYADGLVTNRTARMCKPFTDSFEMGYIQESWCDIHVAIGPDNSIHYNTSAMPELMSHRQTTASTMQTPAHFYSTEFVWRQPWAVEAPKGYSVLVTHPLNQWQLPFVTMTGVLDSDSFVYEPDKNNLPFNIYSWFTGIIPAGTPLFQFIPVKRDNWLRSVEQHDAKAQAVAVHALRRKFTNQYRLLHWSRKSYE